MHKLRVQWHANYIVIRFEPVTSEDSEIAGRRRERDRDSGAAPNSDATKASSSLLKPNRWEVKVTANLILHLQNVSEVPSR